MSTQDLRHHRYPERCRDHGQVTDLNELMGFTGNHSPARRPD
jgi:hypothetical protein